MSDNVHVSSEQGRRYTKEEIERADRRVDRAFALLGLVGPSGPVCPICGTSKRGKVQMKTSQSGRPYWKCHRCVDPGEGDAPRPWGGSAIDLLKQHGGFSFTKAVRHLLSEDDPEGDMSEKVRMVAAAPSFRAVVDVEVYDLIRDSGSVEEAARYYGTWHISPEAVQRAGATYITDAEALKTDLVERYGHDRLAQAGVTTVDSKGRTIFLFSDDYPVVEPHTAPSGHVVGMQFRPSPERMLAVKAHKDWKRRWSGIAGEDGSEMDPSDAWRAAYTKDRSVGARAPYVTPFLSLRGGGPDHLVGGGLHIVHSAPEGSDVYVVEGIKDMMAALTMGVVAYAIPGVSAVPPDNALEVLRRHRILVSLDGDAAGESGREALTAMLADKGVDARAVDGLRPGMDITDVLVERNAHAGCVCSTCSSWRQERGWDPATCACRTCRVARRAGE